MSHKVAKSILHALARLIWFSIIFYVVVHAVQFFETEGLPDTEQPGFLLYLEGSVTLYELLGSYWPKEILIAIVAFILFEAVSSRFASKFAAAIAKKITKAESLEPLGFDIELEAANHRPGLVTIEIRNDETTPMEFVVKIIEEYFHFDRDEAVKLMLQIHAKGSARIQWIDAEKAGMLVHQISREAGKRGYPLECTIVVA